MSTFGISHKYELIRVQENIDYELNSCIEGQKSKITFAGSNPWPTWSCP